MITLTFEPNLEHQSHAINAVVDVFRGQPSQLDTGAALDNFALAQPIDASGSQAVISQQISSQAIANQRIISDEQVLDNIQAVQREHNIEPSTTLYDDDKNLAKYGLNASIEMETGTGKTYVYLRSIYELYQTYGMRKFVIVVPSVAIREGVMKSIEMTKAHFAALYDNPGVDARIYDSKNLNRLRDFATSHNIQILVMNIDAFAKDENIINQVREQGVAPIEYIQATHPIVIVDEPQNMETAKRLDAIASLQPLITLRYSATHKYSRHLLYSLNPVKAYDAGLVKQIEVDSVMTDDAFNEAYIELLDITPKKTKITAKVSVYVNVKGVVNGLHVAFPFLRRTPGSTVINLASASAIYGQAELANYSATKFYVRAVTEALNIEWAGHDIRVIDMWPLYVNTAMTKGVSTGTTQSLGIRLTAQDIADDIVAAVDAPWTRRTLRQVHFPVGAQAKTLALASRFSPGWLTRLVNKQLAHK